MSSTLMTEPAAGWYDDPQDSSALRWWDGATWTDHVRASDEAAQTGPSTVIVEPLQLVHEPQPEPQPEPVFAPVQFVPEPQPEPIQLAPAVVIEPVPTHAPVFDPVTLQPVPAPVAVEPEPVPEAAPAPVTTSTIPQPGQVASGPAIAGGPVSMTPTTPVSDQMYWHSAAAEVIDVPRLNNPSTGAIKVQQRHSPLPSYVRDWNDLGSPNTPGIWLLAFSPFLGFGVYYAVSNAMLTAGVPSLFAFIAGIVASLLLHWIFAAVDTRALENRGYHPPRLSWMLLFPPLAYLIARGKAVRRESKAAWGPELVYILSWVVIIGGAVALSALLVAMYAPLLNIH